MNGTGPALRVLLDGTPLLGHRTGIGRYTAALAAELARVPGVAVRASAFTLRGWRALRTETPAGVAARGLPVPARALRACWSRAMVPPVELLTGTADVVHGTNFVLPPSARAAGVLTVHDLAFLDDPGELPPGGRDLPRLVRRGARRAAVVCTPTAAVGAAVSERLDVPPSRVAVTPLGVDAEWFDAVPPDQGLRRELDLPDRYLLFVGAGGPRKGMAGLVRAHRAAGDLPPLVVAGPAGDAGGAVTRTGFLPDAQLRRVVAGACALVLPSRDEGFGLPVLEAFACGVPVVCSDVPALREVAGGYAEHFPFGEDDALRAALRAALERGTGGAAREARREHARRFTWRACAEATAAAYRRAARER